VSPSTPPRARRRATTTIVVGLALCAALGCEAPFPDAYESGFTPSIQWIRSPAPAETYIDGTRGGVVTERLRNLTRPTESACERMEPGIAAVLCDSYFQGTGIVVRVPEPCQKVAREADVTRLPPVQVEVAGVQVSDPAGVLWPTATGIKYRTAFYFSVGAGVVTSGATIYAEGGQVFTISSRPSPVVPDQASYDVRLTCASGADAGTISTTTYTGTIPRGGFPFPV
jgi:hypothetical protein